MKNQENLMHRIPKPDREIETYREIEIKITHPIDKVLHALISVKNTAQLRRV